MPHRPTFPNGYTKEELADEIVRLSALEDSFLECLESLRWLSEQACNAEDVRARALYGEQLRDTLARIASDGLTCAPADGAHS